jgi:hypothetical protein
MESESSEFVQHRGARVKLAAGKRQHGQPSQSWVVGR